MASTKVPDKNKCWNKNNCHSLSEMLGDHLKRKKLLVNVKWKHKITLWNVLLVLNVAKVAEKLYISIPHTKHKLASS